MNFLSFLPDNVEIGTRHKEGHSEEVRGKKYNKRWTDDKADGTHHLILYCSSPLPLQLTSIYLTLQYTKGTEAGFWTPHRWWWNLVPEINFSFLVIIRSLHLAEIYSLVLAMFSWMSHLILIRWTVLSKAYAKSAALGGKKACSTILDTLLMIRLCNYIDPKGVETLEGKYTEHVFLKSDTNYIQKTCWPHSRISKKNNLPLSEFQFYFCVYWDLAVTITYSKENMKRSM